MANKVNVKDLRQFTVSDLEGRVKEWREELFRSKFKQETSEAPDTSVNRKLKRSIAKALTVINEKRRAEKPTVVQPAAPQDK